MKNILENISINVHNDTIYIMTYGKFCMKQAEDKGMRFEISKIHNKYYVRGTFLDSFLDESFEKIFDTEKDAELYLQEIASNFLGNLQDYIAASYRNIADAASDIINYCDIDVLTEGELDNSCSIRDLENYINDLLKNNNN